MPNVVRALSSFNRGREPERLALKYERMRASPFAFLRGSCHLFYAGIARSTALRAGPVVWACGDLHLENLGSYRGDNGQVYFDINDFDEALLAPASWDLVRLLSSVLVARGSFRASRREARALCTLVLNTYARCLTDGKARWVEREIASPPVRGLLARADASRHALLLSKRTETRAGRRRIKLNPKRALPASAAQKEEVGALFGALRELGTKRPKLKVLDVARRVAGTGSLGLERYVVLAKHGGPSADEHLLDLKVATPPAGLQSALRSGQPSFADDAQRIVAVQRRMQAVSMADLQAIRLGARPFVLRRLLPSEDRVDLAALKRGIDNLLVTASECLAWAQLRSAGRDGSASADMLIAHGADRAWHGALLELAELAAEGVERDYQEFVRAHAAGAFRRRVRA